MEHEKPKLYSYWRSSCSWRVRTALALKNISYEYIPVHLLRGGGEQLKPEYAKLNPMKQVPTLLINGLVLTESLAIIEYLDEVFPTPSLLPPFGQPAQRAKVRELSFIISSIQSLANLKVSKRVGEEQKLSWMQHWIREGFQSLEAVLSQSAGKYSVGDEVTVADLCLVPQVYNARRFNVDLTPYPTIVRVDANLNQLPAFKASHPDRTPDAETQP